MDECCHLWTGADEDALRACQDALFGGDLAGALLAVEGAPRDRSAGCRTTLATWGLEARDLVASSAAGQVDALGEVLVRRHGLIGDSVQYYDIKNSYLTHVVESRRGMPILISAVWMLVGRGAGFDVDGIALPGHFIIRVSGAGGALVDPFRGGVRLSVDDCKTIVHALSEGMLPWRDSFLTPSTCEALVQRVLRNAVGSLRKAGRPSAMFRPMRMLAGISPDAPEVQLAEAVMAGELGYYSRATEVCRDIMWRFPSTHEAKEAAHRLRDLETRTRLLH